MAPDVQDYEASFWEAAECLDSSHTTELSNAVGILHAALDDSYDMILGASDIMKAGTRPGDLNCQGSQCEVFINSQNIASHLSQKGMAPGTQMIIGDDVDAASEGELGA